MRQLAAILFTDIVGYTAIMQEDETKARKIREVHRAVFEQQHQKLNGNIIQYFGDGTLSMFKSAVNAVECAIAMQHAFRQHELRIPVRMGIHSGDIFYDGTEIFGHGVNVAARIEAMSAAGSVLISKSVNNELNNHTNFESTSLGTFSFKNVTDPVEVFIIHEQGLNSEIALDQSSVTKVLDKKSVAVLPFENLSPSQEQAYFCDGMTEEIINALSKIKELRVTSRNSAFRLKDKNLSTAEIGELLNVTTLVVGSIRLSGSKMRISVQLIDVEEDYCFWSDKYDRILEDVFEVQDEVSVAIAERLREYLGHLDIDESLAPVQDIRPEDYITYLKARYHILKMTANDIHEGIKLLEPLVIHSPDYVYGHLGMHMGYIMLGTLGYMPAEKAFPTGMSYLQKAIELEPDLPECNLQQSWISFLQDWDLDKTYAYLSKVHDERPIVDYYQTMASVIVTERNFKAAENYIDTALKMDPLSEITHNLKGFIYYVQHKYDEALTYYRRCLELNPESTVSYTELGHSLLLSGKHDEALTFFENLPSDKSELIKKGGIALVHAFQGNMDLVEKEKKVLEEALQSESMEKALYLLIILECALNNTDKAIQYIRQAFEYRLPMLVYLKIDPIIKPLHNLPEFKELFDSFLTSEKSQPDIEQFYKKSLVSQEYVEQYRAELKTLMSTEKPYLNPHLTLAEVGQLLEIPANQLSQILNAGFDQNFSEFINSYRVQHFKSLLKNPDKKQFTILAIAYESGFNSKSAFNSFFKRSEGMTPKAYLKSVRN